MLRILGRSAQTCDGISRREMLSAGGLALAGGLTLPRWLRAKAEQPRREASPCRSGSPNHPPWRRSSSLDRRCELRP